MDKLELDVLLDYVKEASDIDPALWDHMNVDKDYVFSLIASSIVDKLNSIDDYDMRYIVAVGSLIKSEVENYILNVKLGLMD
jgi:hypothetical protein